jgi:hypothetical protein
VGGGSGELLLGIGGESRGHGPGVVIPKSKSRGESRSATALLRVHPARTRDRLRRPAHRSRLRASGARRCRANVGALMSAVLWLAWQGHLARHRWSVGSLSDLRRWRATKWRRIQFARILRQRRILSVRLLAKVCSQWNWWRSTTRAHARGYRICSRLGKRGIVRSARGPPGRKYG